MQADQAVARRWSDRLAPLVAEFFDRSPALRPRVGRCSPVPHGSTCWGGG